MRYLDGIRYVKIRTNGRGASEKKPEVSPVYLTRWGPELHCCMHISGWIPGSQAVGGNTWIGYIGSLLSYE